MIIFKIYIILICMLLYFGYLYFYIDILSILIQNLIINFSNIHDEINYKKMI
jgi:hypothetical protein